MPPYVGEIRLFAGNFAPNGWLFCSGQLLPIAENDVLFQLLGTTYGGDGQETFAIPDFQSRLPIHFGTNPVTGTSYQIGELAGTESVTLTTQQIPSHTHPLLVTGQSGSQSNPGGATIASGITVYRAATPPTVAMSAQAITPQGGSQPHDNMHPFLCINYIISLFGIFPSQT